MSKEVRVHLTEVQRLRISAATNKRPDSIAASSTARGDPGGSADLVNRGALPESTDVDGPGVKLTDSGKPRPTALIPLP